MITIHVWMYLKRYKIILSCFFLEEVQFVHNRETKVVGAINYKINNIVYEHYQWVIYEMLFREALKSNFISQSNSFGVCNTCFCMCVTNTFSSGKWNDVLNIQLFNFVTACIMYVCILNWLHSGAFQDQWSEPLK